MICVTLGRGRHASLIEEWEAAAKAGAELVELRVDCLRREPDLKRILKERPTPLVFTARRSVDGGFWRGREEQRQLLLREAIALEVDYVDLEVDIADKIPRFGKTKRIISYHNLKTTPDDLGEIAAKCGELDPDVVKVAALAAKPADAARTLRLAVDAKQPTIPIAMGEFGVFTRVLGAKFGAPFTYAGFNPERTFAPGMLGMIALRKDYFYDQINAKTEVYGVIGNPIGHSLSPAIHNAAFRKLGLNKVLVPFQVPRGGLADFLREIDFLNLRGCSVTIPHKEDVIELLSKKENAVQRTGSCNTIARGEDGGWVGYNTDYRAAMDSLEEAMGKEDDPNAPSPLEDKHVLILGAGGVARSIAYGAARRNANVTITNRREERANALAKEIGCRAVPWSLRATTVADVIVNCTPVGMHPEVDETPLPPSAFPRSSMVVFDTIYHPENTMMLKLAREHGCTTQTGVDMFIRQAALQFYIYTEMEAPTDVMRAALKRKLGPLRDE